MKKLLLVLCLTINLFPQIEFDHFPKVGFCDMFQLLNMPLYYRNKPNGNMQQLWQEYINSEFYYPELRELGLNYVQTLGGDYNYQGLYIPAYSLLLPNGYNTNIKVIDHYFTFRLSRYFPPNQFFGGVYAESQGNDFQHFKYEVGGSNATYSFEDGLGFGTTQETAVWVTYPPPLAVGEGETIDEGRVVFSSKTIDHSSGYLLQAELPRWQQARQPELTSWNPEQVEYRFVLNARIDGYTNQNDMTPVATVQILENVIPEEELTDNLQSHPHYPPEGFDSEPAGSLNYNYTIYVKDFGGNSYVNLLSPAYFHKNNGKNAKLKILIYWLDTKNFYIDHIYIYDNFYEQLFLVQDPNPTYNEIKQQFQTVFGNYVTNDLYCHFYLDEPWPNSFKSIGKVSELSNQQFGLNKYINGPTGDFPPWMRRLSNSLRRLPYVFYDKYIFWHVYSPAINDNLQDMLDSLIYQDSRPDYDRRGLRVAIEMAQNYTPNDYSDDVPFMHTIQVQAEKRIENGTIPNDGYHMRLRAPSPNEILVQGFLAICYGAKGLGYYTISTNTEDNGQVNGDFGDYLSTYGLFDEVNNHYSDAGGTISGFIQVPSNPQEPNERFYAVKELNEEISLIEDELLNLTWIEAYSLHKLQPPIQINYITELISKNSGGIQDPPDETFVELGLFKMTSEFNNDLLENFMLVNRRCLADEGRFYNVSYNKPGTPYVNWRVWDVATGENYPGLDQDDFTVYIEPGKGKLFNLQPTVIGGGDLLYNEIINSNIELHGDLVIQGGVTLTVNADYQCYGNIVLNNGSIKTTGQGKIYFHDGAGIETNGISLIYSNTASKLELDFINTENNSGIYTRIGGFLNIYNCIIKNSGAGIHTEHHLNTIMVRDIDFYNCSNYAVNIVGPSGSLTKVEDCTFDDCYGGISVSNVNEIQITGNLITDSDIGIYLSNVPQPYITWNTILSGKKTMPGIFISSSNGLISSNYISGHTNAIHLANSSPDIGANTIEHNFYHAIYIGAGSLPDMHAELLGEDPQYYAVSGYNTISENGGYTTGGIPDNDGSEIYFGSSTSNANMSKGCNSIFDDRSPGGDHPPYNTQLLMNGQGFGIPITIYAERNFWSENPLYPLSTRFGNLNVYYDPELSDPCDGVDEGEALLVKTSSGEVVDTVYVINRTVGTLSSTDVLYSKAEEKYLSADYSGAEQLYNQVVTSNDTLFAKQLAYQRLYEIGKITSKPASYFNNLYDALSSASQLAEDSLLQKKFSQLASLSLVGEEEYIPAIEEFDEIIQQNPGREEAVYAEIDALTTALLIEPGDTTLGKTAAGKYLISIGEYGNRINQLLKNNFGAKTGTQDEKTIPTDFVLYQNYPNPFNPTTTIKLDLPKASNVELIVYDILGRKVTTLLNETKQAGRYEIQFDASGHSGIVRNLASGVYIYQLKSNEFISSRKMILLK